MSVRRATAQPICRWVSTRMGIRALQSPRSCCGRAVMLSDWMRFIPFRSVPVRVKWCAGWSVPNQLLPSERKGPPRVMFILHKCCPKYRSCKHITNRTPQLDGSLIPKSRSDPNPSHRDYAASGWASSICICPKSFGCVNICLKFRTPTTPKECI